MINIQHIAKSGFLLGLIGLAVGCVIAPAPREGYYDRDNHRYYHERAWHECGERNDFCH